VSVAELVSYRRQAAARQFAHWFGTVDVRVAPRCTAEAVGATDEVVCAGFTGAKLEVSFTRVRCAGKNAVKAVVV